MDLEPSLYSIKGIAILDNDGNRILARYYDDTFGSVKEQKAFEKNLFNKTHKANAEIILLDGLICVYRSNVDLYFYVMGSALENELILVNVLNCLYDSVSSILRKNVEKRALLDSMEHVMLALDEICDGGYAQSIRIHIQGAKVVIETEASAVTGRIALRNESATNLESLSEQSVADVGMKLFNSTKEQLKWSLLK